MLPLQKDCDLVPAISVLVNYFCTMPDVTEQTKNILLRVRKDYGGARPSWENPRQTLAYYFATKWDPTQLGTIDRAILELDGLISRKQNQGVEPLRVVYSLLSKSRSTNWYAGHSLGNTAVTSPSLNNRLTCEILEQAQVDGYYAEILETRGPEFCELLHKAITNKEAESKASARAGNDSAGRTNNRSSSEDRVAHHGLASAWNDGTEERGRNAISPLRSVLS